MVTRKPAPLPHLNCMIDTVRPNLHIIKHSWTKYLMVPTSFAHALDDREFKGFFIISIFVL